MQPDLQILLRAVEMQVLTALKIDPERRDKFFELLAMDYRQDMVRALREKPPKLIVMSGNAKASRVAAREARKFDRKAKPNQTPAYHEVGRVGSLAGSLSELIGPYGGSHA